MEHPLIGVEARLTRAGQSACAVIGEVSSGPRDTTCQSPRRPSCDCSWSDNASGFETELSNFLPVIVTREKAASCLVRLIEDLRECKLRLAAPSRDHQRDEEAALLGCRIDVLKIATTESVT
jgi:hypothetical protein